jgi:mono/diheme cytochrome c family protein
MFRHRLLWGLVAVALGGAAVANQDDPASSPKLPAAATKKIDFVRDIQPIFARSCYTCHGPEKQKSGLRLDRRQNALAGGDSGPAFEAGKSEESLLIEYVAGVDPDTVMPPKGQGERLTTDEVALLRAWIDQGAAWPGDADRSIASGAQATKHWSFQPIRRPNPPAVHDRAWLRRPIDAFVLAKLEELGIAPSPEADRSTLIRRLSLDLLGLPPQPDDVERFLNDRSPDAYERLVDRLLASPHFGERWGRHWLDLARYADSDGYEKDSPRPSAWRYRNWVIDAINRDLPFDQFTIEQLAGDLLPNPTIAQKTATGFHRNTLTNREGGVDQEEYRVAAVVDRVNTTGTVWLGLTVACAQCHTHKYDPILQREYYGLFAFFNNGQELDLPAPLPGEPEAYAQAKALYDVEHEKLQTALDDDDKQSRPARQAEWERTVSVPKARWSVLRPFAASSAKGAQPKVQQDGSIAIADPKPDEDVYTIRIRTDLARIRALRLEVIDDSKAPRKAGARARDSAFALNEFHVKAEASDHRDGGEARVLRLADGSAEPDGSSVHAAIDGDPKTGWTIEPASGRHHIAVFETERDTGFDGAGMVLEIVLDLRFDPDHRFSRFRLSASRSERPVVPSLLPDDVVEVLAVDACKRTEAQRNRLAAYHRSIDQRSVKLAQAVADHAKKAPAPPASKVQTLAENAKPRKTHVLLRGDFLRPGDEVSAHTLAVLPPFQPRSSAPDRLDLARWLVEPSNPLTTRVTVNRMWSHLFGRALVPTLGDFGTRGEQPSHPELLDWLASELSARGWSQKALIKEIVCSATYRQSSHDRPDLRERDPNNVWLARQSRTRLEAEILRDVCLAASGLLAPRLGGPSVRPPQPAGIADLTYAGSAKWVESKGPDRYRRGLYTWFQRTSPYPMLMTFDAPDSNVCCVRRERSNTPLQALTLLNDSVFVECAQALGRRIASECGCALPRERIQYAFRICLARDPSDEEASILARSYETLLKEFQARPEESAKIVGTSGSQGSDRTEVAAWIAIGRTIMNLDEFVTRE